MMNQSPDFIDLLGSDALTEDSIELSPEHIDRAVQMSRSIAHAADSWQAYIYALALFGFKQWLNEWAAELAVNDANYSIHSVYAEQAICYIRIDQLTIGVVASPSLLHSTVNVPKALLDLPQWTPHVYVLMEVNEEQMQTRLCGSLRWDQLRQHRQSQHLYETSESEYAIPLNWFNPDPAILLVELHTLDVPTLEHLWTAENNVTSDDRRVNELNPTVPTPSAPQRSLNAGHWLSDRLDEMAQSLGWLLLPPLRTASALRSVHHELDMLEVPIPPEARGIYRDVQLGRTSLRLYAMTWILSSNSGSFEWTLLIILGAQPGTSRLPNGLNLQIRDHVQLLSDVLLDESSHSYLYAQVGGGLDDQFSVTISLPDTGSITFPPFVFKP